MPTITTEHRLSWRADRRGWYVDDLAVNRADAVLDASYAWIFTVAMGLKLAVHLSCAQRGKQDGIYIPSSLPTSL